MMFRNLPNNGPSTTPIGFGCAYIVSGFDQRKSTRLIHAALDAGIRHFDVAPSYGLGTAEDALGIALAGRRGKVTIASKAGLRRQNVSSGIMLARALVAPLRKRFSGFTGSVGRRLVQTPRGQFGVAEIAQSLYETLGRLKTDSLDLFLLHEAKPEDLSDELLRFMEDVRKKGVARAIGVASDRSTCETIASVNCDFFDVFQYSWSALDYRELQISKAGFVITHRAILNALNGISDWLARDPEARMRLSNVTGFSLESKAALADLLLGAALFANGSGIVLAASRNVERVKHFGDVMRDQEVRTAGAKLLKAILSEDSRPRLQADTNEST
jgi:D-threo-aldose 1-dehydrogenase